MNSIINDDLKNSVSRLWQEVKNDIYFFGACGFLVALMCVWEGRFEEFGILKNSKWALSLFNDFLPARAFGFIFSIYIFSGIIINNFGCNSIKVKNILQHIGSRLNQIGSSIVTFALGFAAFTSGAFLFSCELSWLILTIVVLLFTSFFTEIIIMAELLAQRKKPFDKFFIFVAITSLCNYILFRLVAT